ncbi:MAG: hypothetical protein MPJ50_02120 [Pirellulales bacterium]|nr:hypothetical protein [Pirellulales bacterium]
MHAPSFGKALSCLVILASCVLLAGCRGETEPVPPAIFSDARLANAARPDLDRLLEFAGEEVIVEEGEKLAVYLGASNIANVEEINAVLPAVARIPNIAKLYLNGTPVTDESMAEIAKLESLETVNLDGSRITDNGLAQLSELPNLKTVFCRKTEVTVQGAAKLRDEKGILVTR